MSDDEPRSPAWPCPAQPVPADRPRAAAAAAATHPEEWLDAGRPSKPTCCALTPLLALALRAAADGTTARVTVDTAVAYNSSDWSSSWVELESVRNILEPMNGPREVYAFDDEHGAYDTAQYASSFDELAPYAVRFNDMNYLNGGSNSSVDPAAFARGR